MDLRAKASVFGTGIDVPDVPAAKLELGKLKQVFLLRPYGRITYPTCIT